MYGKLKSCGEHIKTNLHGQDIPYDIYCSICITVVSKVVSVYKPGKNYHHQEYVERCK